MELGAGTRLTAHLCTEMFIAGLLFDGSLLHPEPDLGNSDFSSKSRPDFRIMLVSHVARTIMCRWPSRSLLLGLSYVAKPHHQPHQN